MLWSWWVLAITTIAVAAIQEAHGADTSNNSAETEEVTVTAEATGSLTSISPKAAMEQKTQVPGSFTVKTTDDMGLGRASNFEDLLQRTPGVFLQSENGTEVSKISIRGSGITSEDEPLGVMFLIDGLNFNQGDGEASLEDLDVATTSCAEVFRGANAFKYGALTLGGAINLVPFTGYTAVTGAPSMGEFPGLGNAPWRCVLAYYLLKRPRAILRRHDDLVRISWTVLTTNQISLRFREVLKTI